MSLRTVLLAGLLALTLAGCLPEAGPGPGQRRVEGRGMAMLAAALPAVGQSPTIFFSRQGAPLGIGPGFSARARDLYVSRPGEAADELLLPDFTWGCCGPRFDARGRLYTAKGSYDRPGQQDRTLIIDPANRAPIDLGVTSTIRELMSPRGQQYAYVRADGITVVRTTSDDVERQLHGPLHDFQFIDEVLYASDGRELWRVRPDGSAPERLAGTVGKAWYAPIITPGREPAFVVLEGDLSCSRSDARLLLTDPAIAQEPLGTVDLGTRGLFIDGLTVMLREPSTTATEVAFRVVTLEPRSTRRIVIPTGPAMGQTPPPAGQPRPGPNPPGGPPRCDQVDRPLELRLRPGSEEIWALAPGRLTIVHPDGRVEQLTGPFQGFEPLFRLTGQRLDFEFGGPTWRVIGQGDPPFSSDGRLWTYRDTSGRLQVASTSDPAGPPVVVLPSGQPRGVGEVPSGKTLLVWSGGERRDVHLLDLDPIGRRRTLADVRQMVIGQQRLLARTQALVNDRFAPGPLDLIDLPGGEVHRLASHVTEFLALPACPGCDPTGATAGLVYVASARVPWEHDGLWTATLPPLPAPPALP